MRRFLVIAASLFALILLVVLGALAYILLRYPDAGPVPVVTVGSSPAMIGRGRYLVQHVAVCGSCHSERDWAKFSGPVIPGTEGRGGYCFDDSAGYPGKICAANITPAGIGRMSDGDILHAITTGVGRDQRSLFPVMPYRSYDQLSEDDLLSIVAYLRTLKPLPDAVPPTKLNFPMNIIVRLIPAPHTPHQAPDTSNTEAYGHYLVTAAGCITCHTQQNRGELVRGMEFAGGVAFRMPGGTVRSANITPDDQTGIGSWDRDLFVAKFEYYGEPDTSHLSISDVGYNSMMPWTMYAGMTRHDIEAIYTYLRSLPSVHNEVTPFTPRAAAP